MSSYLLAGGGTAGHVNPLLAVADVLRAREPDARILVLGTREGLEARLVPARGYELATIEKLPFPRRPDRAALRFPGRFRRAVAEVRRLLAEREVQVVAGFGGYASAPAYVAARGRAPVVIHEANAVPGLANRLGARWAHAVAVAFEGTPIRGGVPLGMPLRAEIAGLDRRSARPAAIRHFGLDPERPTLLVTGGSQGARRINDTIGRSAERLVAEGWQLIHLVGRQSAFETPRLRHHLVLEYCDRMDLALAAADFVVSRAGASTVSELTAVGLPALYIPYPVGNGEQAHNIRGVLAAGGGRTVRDADFTPAWLLEELLPLLADREAVREMGRRAADTGVRDSAERVAALIEQARQTAYPVPGSTRDEQEHHS